MPVRFSLISCAVLLVLATPSPHASAQGIFLTPVANAPFSAVVNVERTIVRPDGSVLQLKSTQEVARDTQGRIHNEFRTLVPASSTGTPQLVNIHLYDPQTRVSTEINVRRRTFSTVTMNHPPSTEPPSIRFAAPDGNAPPNDFTQQEDLGVREIEGVPAHGIREVQKVTDPNDGKDVVVTDEYWYSQDLRINLLVKHSDPRLGTNTLTVAHISRTEPDAVLFEVPQGYTRPGPQPVNQPTQ